MNRWIGGAFLFTFLLVGLEGQVWGENVSPLEKTLVENTWMWSAGNVEGGEAHFGADHKLKSPTGPMVWTWAITGPKTFTLSNKGGVTTLTFTDDFTRFEGPSVNHQTVFVGVRKTLPPPAPTPKTTPTVLPAVPTPTPRPGNAAIVPPAFPSAAGPMPESEITASFGVSTPEKEGVSREKLAQLTEWLRDSNANVFSILISRNGKLIYELYTNSLSRDEAHYVMSVTKSFTSTLVTIAVDKGLLAPVEAPVTRSIPRSLFESDDAFRQFSSVSMKDVLGMSALDAKDFPLYKTPDAIERNRLFSDAENRPKFALTQKLLPERGKTFQYNNLTPLIATAALQCATRKSEFDFAQEVLFSPLGFKNTEWMHQDRAGFDHGSYGLRVRPIDMQKYGNLFLAGGLWNGRQIISSDWAHRTFQPYIKSYPQGPLYYGWFWRVENRAPNWQTHDAEGIWGQEIMVAPQHKLVVSITSYMPENSEKVIDTIIKDFIIPAVQSGSSPTDQKLIDRLQSALETVRSQRRMPRNPEQRMVPSIAPKGRHMPFTPPA